MNANNKGRGGGGGDSGGNHAKCPHVNFVFLK